jgi:hypothetical protein
LRQTFSALHAHWDQQATVPDVIPTATALSIILPAKNEAEGLQRTLPALRARAIHDADDHRGQRRLHRRHRPGRRRAWRQRAVSNPYSMGNGAAIKRGARAASGDILVFMDADGQHERRHIAALLAKLDEGYDMVVGARDRSGQANVHRGLANGFYNRVGQLDDRAPHRRPDLRLPRGARRQRSANSCTCCPTDFSYPTTSTMAFFRSAYPVAYVPIPVAKRVGTNSHIRPLKDGVRFLLIIFKIATCIRR